MSHGPSLPSLFVLRLQRTSPFRPKSANSATELGHCWDGVPPLDVIVAKEGGWRCGGIRSYSTVYSNLSGGTTAGAESPDLA